MSTARLFAALALPVCLLGGAAEAQSLTPMLGRVASYGETFRLRVHPHNPFPRRMRMEVRVYDHEFRQVRALISPWRFGIGANDTRVVNVEVPFNGRAARKVRVCVEAMPYKGTNQRIKTQVCGKFIAKRVR